MLFLTCSVHKQRSTMSVRLFQVTVDSVAECRLNKGYTWLWKLLNLLLFSRRYWLLQGCFGITALWLRGAILSPPVLFIHLRWQFSPDFCRDERERDKLDLMIVSIILILQRLLLVLITFCTIYVVCKSSDLHCAPNNSRAVCLSCSSLSLLLWKQIVPCFIGRIFFFFCDRFGYDASGIESPGIILYNQVLLEEFLEDGWCCLTFVVCSVWKIKWKRRGMGIQSYLLHSVKRSTAQKSCSNTSF